MSKTCRLMAFMTLILAPLNASVVTGAFGVLPHSGIQTVKEGAEPEYVLVPAAKKEKSKKKNREDEIDSFEDAVSVSVPVQNKKRSFFSSINSEIMSLAEDGSALSLKTAAFRLHRADQEDYSESERTLLFILSETMKIVWPSQTVTWDVPDAGAPNQYTGALESVRKGIFDLSTTDSDFFSSLLPLLVYTQKGDYEEYFTRSRFSIEKVLEMRPDSVLANYIGGLFYMACGEFEEAEECLLNAERRDSDIEEIQAALGETEFKMKEYGKALVRGEKLLAKFPQDQDALRLCALSAFHSGDFAKAENYIIRVLLRDPNNTEYILLRARILMENQDYIRAASLLDVCQKTNSNSKTYLLLRSRLYREWNKNFNMAADVVSQALSLYPSDPEVRLFAAEIASSTGKPVAGKNALELAEKVLESDPENSSALVIKTSELVKSRQFQTAYNLSSSLAGKHENDRKLVFSHIDICLELGKNDEAFSWVSKIYRDNSGDEECQKCYIRVLSASGRKQEALSLIERLLPSANSRMKSFLYYERSFFDSTEEAVLGNLRSSLTSNPRNKDSLYRLYTIYYNKKDWRRAQYYLKQVVALDSSNADLLKKNSELDSLLAH